MQQKKKSQLRNKTVSTKRDFNDNHKSIPKFCIRKSINRYLFGLEIDQKRQKVFLKVLDCNYNLIEKIFSALEERRYRKN